VSTSARVHELRICPGCGADRSLPIPLGDPPLRRCQACRVVFAPRFADPDDVYTEGYLFGHTEFGLDLSHPLFQEYLAHAAAIRMERIEQVQPVGTMLDVGCGTGEVLAVAAARGWQVTGVEPVAESASFARDRRGLAVHPTTLQESGLPEKSFDVVTTFHVVEHMADGPGFIRTLARWVRPGGHVVVEVPNWRSFHRRNAGSFWSGLRPLEHVAHYGPSTLAATFRRAGVEPVRVSTPTFLWEKQTLDQRLDDVGLYRWKGRLDRFGRPGEQNGAAVVYPSRGAGRALSAIGWAYDRLRVGQVVIVVGRVE
jgi:SAM-dependent methyltransferase